MPEQQSIFFDFMCAVAVGAALPRIGESKISAKDPTFWGVWFFLAAFLEDFYLYHTKVLRHLDASFPPPSGFILTMMIVIVWYIAQTSFPANLRLSQGSFAAFFALKLAGSAMLIRSIHLGANWAFVIPIAVGSWLSCDSRRLFRNSPWHSLLFMFPAWLISVVLWWSFTSY